MDTPEHCECGHRSSEHVANSKECTDPNCKCKAVHWVDLSKAKDRVCFHCGKTYKCSHPLESEEGICNICRKEIETKYPGDLMQALFGYQDNLIAKLKSQVLAMEIHNNKVTIYNMWEFWKANH